MPEFTKSSVGSFAGTSELEGTMVWPFERKYSRKLERISLDFIGRFYSVKHDANLAGNAFQWPASLAKKPGAPRTPRETPLLGVDATVLQKPCPHRSHGALVR